MHFLDRVCLFKLMLGEYISRDSTLNYLSFEFSQREDPNDKTILNLSLIILT